MSHGGVLFLDEIAEFLPSVLDGLRQPLEERMITVSRARLSVEFPANFMLIASMNPCPCGYYNHPDKECVCGPQNVRRYLSRVSGPLLDRIDLQLEVTPVKFEALTSQPQGESSAEVRARVVAARARQQKRFENYPGIHCNAMMPSQLMRKFCKVDSECQGLLQKAMDILGFSARAFDRILKVSRTIADLHDSDKIMPDFVAEAIQYRNLDRENWAG